MIKVKIKCIMLALILVKKYKTFLLFLHRLENIPSHIKICCRLTVGKGHSYMMYLAAWIGTPIELSKKSDIAKKNNNGARD